MSYAWQTTGEDVQTVLNAHNIQADENRALNILDKLDHDAIEKHVLKYDSMDAQSAAMLENIEDQLSKQGVIPGGNKLFHAVDEE